MTREEAKALADRALSFSPAEQTRVHITSEWAGNTRFAEASITTSGDSTNVVVVITATVGRRRASASTNVLDDASLKRTAELAAQLARLSPEDPELMPELGPQSYDAVGAYVERTADLNAEARATAVRRVVDSAVAAGKPAGNVFVAGFLDVNARITAVATSAGLFAYHRSTEVDLSVTSRTPDGTGSGWARSGTRDWAKVDAPALGRIASQKAVASRNPSAFEPGPFTAILEPQAVNDLIPLLGNALSARNADEGRSPFATAGGGTRVGEKVVDERVTLYSDPTDAGLLGAPFDEEGLPVRRIVWIEKGVLKNLAYTRFWAQRQGAQPTGGQTLLGGLTLAGGTKTTEELIAATERGILLTRLWYIRALDARTALQTGLTRDGTFLVENGKITRALKNFRWNESPLLMLNRLEDLGRPEPVAAGRMMPALRIARFGFSSLSDAV
jgi:predicted Zn-dependent protease